MIKPKDKPKKSYLDIVECCTPLSLQRLPHSLLHQTQEQDCYRLWFCSDFLRHILPNIPTKHWSHSSLHWWDRCSSSAPTFSQFWCIFSAFSCSAIPPLICTQERRIRIPFLDIVSRISLCSSWELSFQDHTRPTRSGQEELEWTWQTLIEPSLRFKLSKWNNFLSVLLSCSNDRKKETDTFWIGVMKFDVRAIFLSVLLRWLIIPLVSLNRVITPLLVHWQKFFSCAPLL